MNTLIDIIEQTMKFNTQDRIHQSELLESFYRTVGDRERLLLDQAFLHACGTSLRSLMQ